MTKAKDSGGNFFYPACDTSGNLHTKIVSGLTGALAQFNRLAGGAIAQYVDVSADGIPTGMSAPVILYGVKCLAGTNPTLAVYDAASATGDAMISTGTATIGTYYPVQGTSGGDLGVILNIGGYADIGGTDTPKFRIFFAPAA